MSVPLFIDVPELVGIERFCELVGVYTEGAIRKKIARGIWVEDQVIKHGPDGHVFIIMRGFYKWVRGGSNG